MIRILIVDDERGIVDTMKAYFSPQYEVLTAYSGEEAIQKAEMQPDLILLDVNLPDGEGFAFCRWMKERREVPVIFLTARDDADSVKGVLSLKPSGYLLKTLGHAEIKARVDGFFEKNP